MFRSKNFRFRNILVPVVSAMAILACDDNSTGPTAENKPNNILVGKWAELFPDTTTGIGRTIYQERTGFGTPWAADTMIFKEDSSLLSKPNLNASAFTSDKYFIKHDTLFNWNPDAPYDTNKTVFEVRNDTLLLGDSSMPYRTPYTRY